MPDLAYISWNSFPVYSPPLSVLIFLIWTCFCHSTHTVYFLKESVMVLHSLFLRKSRVVNLDLQSIQVIKYLYLLMDSSNGPHISETTRSPMLVGIFSVCWNEDRICFPNGQLMH